MLIAGSEGRSVEIGPARVVTGLARQQLRPLIPFLAFSATAIPLFSSIAVSHNFLRAGVCHQRSYVCQNFSTDLSLTGSPEISTFSSHGKGQRVSRESLPWQNKPEGIRCANVFHNNCINRPSHLRAHRSNPRRFSGYPQGLRNSQFQDSSYESRDNKDVRIVVDEDFLCWRCTTSA